MMQVLIENLKGVHLCFSEEMHVPCLEYDKNLVMQEALKDHRVPLTSLGL